MSEYYTKDQIDAIATQIGNRFAHIHPAPSGDGVYSLKREGVNYSWFVSRIINKASADFDIDSIVLEDFPGVSLPMLAGETWKFDITLYALSLNATADLRVNITGDATGRYGVAHAENAVSKSGDINSATTNIAVATGSAVNADTIMIHGIATANTDTSLQLQLRNNAGTVVQSFSEFSNIEGVFVG